MWSVLSLLASAQAEDAFDPGCRGRVSKRDTELEFELQFDGEGKAVRSVLLRPGAGPSFARGSVQTRLRGRMDALHLCYEPHVDATRGPDVTLLVGFDVLDGRPANVSIESAFADAALEECVQEVVEQTPMLCRLEATGFVYPVRFSTVP